MLLAEAPTQPAVTTSSVAAHATPGEPASETRYNASTYRDAFLTVTRAKTSLDLDGWNLAAQRHSVQVPWSSAGRDTGLTETIKITCVRLTNPTGQVVHLMLNNTTYAKDERGALTTALSAPIGALLRDTLSPAAHQAGMEALAAVFDTATALAHGAPDHGFRPHDLVRLTAHGQDIPATAAFLDRLWDLARASDHTNIPLHRAQAMDAVTAGYWVATGATPERVWAFLGHRSAMLSSMPHADVLSLAKYIQSGWTRAEYAALCEALRRAPRAISRVSGSAWAALGARDALIAVQTGFAPAEVARLRRAGTWNAEAAQTLSALRSA